MGRGEVVARIADAELLEGLREFGEVVGGRAFTVAEYRAWPRRRSCPETVIKRFGSWRSALARVGIDGARAKEYPAGELLADFERVWRETGKAPTWRMMMQRGRYSLNAYRHRWGSVVRLRDLVSRLHRGEVSRARVLRGEPREAARRRRLVGVGVRWKVLKRDGYRCRVCGRSPAVTRGVELHVDHIVPVCRGGGNEEANLRTLCRECNAGKGGRGELGTGNG